MNSLRILAFVPAFVLALAVETIDFRGAGVAAAVSGNKATVTVSGGSGGLDAAGVREQIGNAIQAGANVTITPAGTGASRTFTISSTASGGSSYDDGPLTARVGAVEAFEAAMRRTRDIGTASITEGVSNALVASGLTLPTTAQDRTVIVRIDGEDPDRFALADLLAKSDVSTPGTQASSTNSVSVTADGGDVISFALSSTGHLWIADDTVASRHSIGVSLDEPDLEAFARASSAAPVPAAKLPVASGSQAGIIGSTEFARIDNAVVLDSTGFTAADDGSFPAWNDADSGWDNAVLGDTAGKLKAEYSTANTEWTLDLDGKLAEIYNAFDGGSWTDVNGSAATTPFVSTGVPPSVQPTTGAGLIYAISGGTRANPRYSNVWIVVRIPLAVDYRTTRYRLAVGEIAPIPLDSTGVVQLPSDATYEYYAVPVLDKPAASLWRVETLTPFEPEPSRLELVTEMLRDMPTAAQQAAGHPGQVLELDTARTGYVLGDGRPAPVSQLPARFVTGRRYILDAAGHFQPWYDVTPAAGGNNDPARAASAQGLPSGWTLVKYANALTLDSQVRGQLVLTRPSASTALPIAIGIDGRTYNLSSKLTGTHSHSFVVQAAPAFNAGTSYEIWIVLAADSPATNLPARVDYAIGDYTATSPQVLVATPGACAPWACVGSTQRVPQSKLPAVGLTHLTDPTGDGVVTGNGLAITNSAATVHSSSSLELFSPAFDLDDPSSGHGKISVEVIVTISGRSNEGLSFDPDNNGRTSAADDLSATCSGFEFSDLVLAASAFVSGTGGGREVCDLTIYIAGVKVGDVEYRLIRDANDNLGRHKIYRGASSGYTWNLQFREEVTYEANTSHALYETEPSGRGRLIATWDLGNTDRTIETGALLEVAPTIETAFNRAGLFRRDVYSLEIPRIYSSPGIIIEGYIGDTITSRLWVPHMGLMGSSRSAATSFSGANFSMHLGLMLSLDSTSRLIAVEVQRQINARYQDYVRLYSISGNVYKANSEVRIYEWLP